MADITMCHGERIELEGNKIIKTGENICPLRNECYRFKAMSGFRQSFSLTLPYSKETNTCVNLYRR